VIPGRRPLRIAHRGASARAPENTLAAFAAAIADGADAVELDVQRTRDGVPVVLHDPTLDRTTDGTGPLAATTLSALRRLDAGAWFDPRFRGERVPTLEEALECVRGRCGLNVELKIAPARGGTLRSRARRSREEAALLAEAVAGVLEQVRFDGFLLLSSFSAAALRAARAAMPRARLALLASRRMTGLGATHRALALEAVNLHLRLATRRRFGAARRLGLGILVWAVDDLENLRRVEDLGADGIMTDDVTLFDRLAPAPEGPPRRSARLD
jgi:glycerophosphoryl diester phosphodiesterase